jgi:aspartate-semialdehyde dehydrogenase
MKVILAGATGMVGKEMLKVLANSTLNIDTIYPVATEKSWGKTIEFKGNKFEVIGFEKALESDATVAIFSAGGGVSKEMAPKFAAKGITVVDNSSAWRMDPGKKLIVPEINASSLTANDKIIANPNCSTIQMVMALAPLHDKYGIKRLIISTYQSVSGTGYKAVNQMNSERAGKDAEVMAYSYKIDKNCIPHCDDFLDNGYTKEEMKLVNETHKILGDDSIRITATAVRVPVDGGHSESVNIELEKDFELDDIRNILQNTEGIEVMDDVKNEVYPMPLFAKNKDEVFVGRIRRDTSYDKALNMWIVADNLRKGAATNAVQIVEYLVENKLV